MSNNFAPANVSINPASKFIHIPSQEELDAFMEEFERQREADLDAHDNGPRD